MVNVTPRYARLKAADKKEVLGWENIELISDRPLEVMLEEFTRLKKEFPGRCQSLSIPKKHLWQTTLSLNGKQIAQAVGGKHCDGESILLQAKVVLRSPGRAQSATAGDRSSLNWVCRV